MPFVLSDEPESAPRGRFELSAEPEEGAIKEGTRTALQAPLGYAKKHTWLADVVSLLGQAAVPEVAQELSESDWLNKMLAEKQGQEHIPINRQQVTETGREAIGKYAPTQENAEELIEQLTGVPLRPKGPGQEALRLAGTAAGFRPGGIGQKLGAAGIATGGKEALEAIGLPPGIAEFLALAVSTVAPFPTSASKAVKPSGLPTRRYESIKKPTRIPGERADIIKGKVEDDFRKIAEKHLMKNETYRTIKENPNFVNEIAEGFDEVRQLAKEVPGQIPKEDFSKAFRQRYRNLSRERKGFVENEYEKTLRKEMAEVHNDIENSFKKDIYAEHGEEQFRKNNKALSELFEPGKSSAANRAKKNALLEFNRAIEDVFESNYPGSQFSRFFREVNNQWSLKMAAEEADAFIDSIFKDKIDYKQARKLFENEYYQRSFKQLLGKEGYNDIKQLVEDLSTTEKGMRNIRRATSMGKIELAKMAAAYTISPKIAATREGWKLAKWAWQATLDKPRLAITWSHGLNAFKNGKWAEAQKDFERLQAAAKANAVKHPEVLKEAPKTAAVAPKQGETINITPKSKQITGREAKHISTGPEAKRLTKKEKPKPPRPSMKEAEAKAKERSSRTKNKEVIAEGKKKIEERVKELEAKENARPEKVDHTKKNLLSEIEEIKSEIRDINKEIPQLEHSIEHSEYNISSKKRLEKVIKRKNELDRILRQKEYQAKPKTEEIYERPAPTQTREQWEASKRKEYPEITPSTLNLMSKTQRFLPSESPVFKPEPLKSKTKPAKEALKSESKAPTETEAQRNERFGKIVDELKARDNQFRKTISKEETEHLFGGPERTKKIKAAKEKKEFKQQIKKQALQEKKELGKNAAKERSELRRAKSDLKKSKEELRDTNQFIQSQKRRIEILTERGEMSRAERDRLVDLELDQKRISGRVERLEREISAAESKLK